MGQSAQTMSPVHVEPCPIGVRNSLVLANRHHHIDNGVWQCEANACVLFRPGVQLASGKIDSRSSPELAIANVVTPPQVLTSDSSCGSLPFRHFIGLVLSTRPATCRVLSPPEVQHVRPDCHFPIIPLLEILHECPVQCSDTIDRTGKLPNDCASRVRIAQKVYATLQRCI
jgi:hypothetical protein